MLHISMTIMIQGMFGVLLESSNCAHFNNVIKNITISNVLTATCVVLDFKNTVSIIHFYV